MSLLSVDELKILVEQPQELCISIYMPVTQGVDIQQNPIRFKNLLRETEEKLVEYGCEQKQARELLEPVQAEFEQDNFWEEQRKVLAIFAAPGFFRYYKSPIDFEELVVVSDAFHVKPLMPLVAGDGLFYILALSQDEVRLIECTRYSAREVEVKNLPHSLDEALQYDETAKEGQYRISTSKGGTNNSFTHAGSFHGQGSPDRDKRQEDILQYFHIIDRAVQEHLHGKKAPLVLAGVEYLFPIYREANTYQHLVAEGLTGNPKMLKAQDLQAEALPIVEPLFSQVQEEAIAQYRELAGVQKTSADLNETLSAAYFGRVDRLFVAMGVQKWGTFNPETGKAQVHSEAEVGDEDLLNSAAIQTILNGGTVYAVPPEKVPEAAPIAAIFRY